MGQLRVRVAKKSDERIRSMEELIGAIRVIKMYCWEAFCVKKIMKARADEIYLLKIRATLLGVMTFISYYCTYITPIITYLYILYQSPIDSFQTSDVFVTYNLCVICGYHLKLFMDTVYTLAEIRNTNKRITDVLLLDEVDTTTYTTAFRKKSVPLARHCLTISNLDCSYPNVEDHALKNINISISKNDFIAVIGPVGSGKTTLFNLLLNDLVITKGSFVNYMSISLAPQEPWILEGTIKENILIGRDFNERRYQEVLAVSCLESDIELLDNKDETYIGDRGITLSGGQKARVGLARAIYVEADLYLLDDPLSAVDPVVASKIFHKCINGFLNDKARILATHQYQFLQDVPKILHLDHGKQLCLGSYNDLCQESRFLQDIGESNKYQEQSNKQITNNEVDGEHSLEYAAENKQSGQISGSDILYFLKANGSNLLAYSYIAVKLLVHGCLAWTEVMMAYFANTAQDAHTLCENDASCASGGLVGFKATSGGYISEKKF